MPFCQYSSCCSNDFPSSCLRTNSAPRLFISTQSKALLLILDQLHRRVNGDFPVAVQCVDSVVHTDVSAYILMASCFIMLIIMIPDEAGADNKKSHASVSAVNRRSGHTTHASWGHLTFLRGSSRSASLRAGCAFVVNENPLNL